MGRRLLLLSVIFVLFIFADSKDATEESSSAPYFPNIAYLGGGFDILLGNPNGVGPSPNFGFRGSIFNLTIYNGQLTPDQRYQIPAGVQVSLCQSCSTSFQSTILYGGQTYQNLLKSLVKANYTEWPAAFGGSYEFGQIETSTDNNHDVFTSSSTTCYAYCPQLMTFELPPLTQEFLNAIEYSWNNGEYSYSSYVPLFKTFGTHSIVSGAWGSSFGQVSQFSPSGWMTFELAQTDVVEAASYSAYSVAVSPQSLTPAQQALAANFSSESIGQQEWSFGSPLPSNGSEPSWLALSQEVPMPIQYDLVPISALLISELFPSDPNITLKQQNLEMALSEYCGNLAENNAIQSCSGPPNDPNPPAPFVTCNCVNVVVDIMNSGQYPPWMGPNEGGYDYMQLMCPPNTFATTVISASDDRSFIYAWGKNQGYPSSGITCCQLCPLEANNESLTGEVSPKPLENNRAQLTSSSITPTETSVIACNCNYQMDSINSASSYPPFLQPNSQNTEWTSIQCPNNQYLVELDCSIDGVAHWLSWGKNAGNPTCGIQCCDACYGPQNTTAPAVGSAPVMVNNNYPWPGWMPPNSLSEPMIGMTCPSNQLATGIWSSIGSYGDWLAWGSDQESNPSVAILCSSVQPLL